MIKIANAPCSWGVLEFELEGKAAGYTRVLDEMRETGYAGTELGDWGFMPTDPRLLSAELKQRDLTLLGAFVPVALKDPSSLAAGIEAAVRTACLLAAVQGELPFIVLADNNGSVPMRTQNAGRIRPEHGLSDAEWQVFAAGAQRVAEAVKREAGLRTVFHHHCGGYVETPAEIARLMSLTDPLGRTTSYTYDAMARPATVTDGRGNVAIDGRTGSDDAMRAASRIQLSGARTLVIDAANVGAGASAARSLAEAAGAEYVGLPSMSGATLAAALESRLSTDR